MSRNKGKLPNLCKLTKRILISISKKILFLDKDNSAEKRHFRLNSNILTKIITHLKNFILSLQTVEKIRTNHRNYLIIALKSSG